MTLEEAKLVAACFYESDGGGCSSCMGDLAKAANRLLPRFNWWTDEVDLSTTVMVEEKAK